MAPFKMPIPRLWAERLYPLKLFGQNPRILKSGLNEATFYEEIWAVLLRGRGGAARWSTVIKMVHSTLWKRPLPPSTTPPHNGLCGRPLI